ncbi:MAG: response regulator [Cyclobacteriaceae bacterium]
MKILYADDDSDDREFFAHMLAAIDPEIKLVQAVDGVETLRLLAGAVLPDLIFLDINMPKLNGVDTLKEIRKDSRLKDTKVIMYSTSINKSSIRGYEAMNASFLKKPNSMHEGIKAVRMVLQQRSVPCFF